MVFERLRCCFGIFNVFSCPECWSSFKGKAEIAAHFQEVDPGVTDMVSECICVYQDSICTCPFKHTHTQKNVIIYLIKKCTK